MMSRFKAVMRSPRGIVSVSDPLFAPPRPGYSASNSSGAIEAEVPQHPDDAREVDDPRPHGRIDPGQRLSGAAGDVLTTATPTAAWSTPRGCSAVLCGGGARGPRSRARRRARPHQGSPLPRRRCPSARCRPSTRWRRGRVGRRASSVPTCPFRDATCAPDPSGARCTSDRSASGRTAGRTRLRRSSTVPDLAWYSSVILCFSFSLTNFSTRNLSASSCVLIGFVMPY